MDNEPLGVDTKNEIPSLLPLLPALSAQPYPITIIRENSTLTKRISYSDSLKERLSWQFQRPIRLNKHGKEISAVNCQSSFRSVPGNLKNTRQVQNVNATGERLCSDTCSNERSKDLQMEILKQKNSFKECQHIFMKIQRKISSKSLKKSKLKRTRVNFNHSGELLGRHKLKQKISAVGLLKNEGVTKNQNIFNSDCLQDSCGMIKIKKKDIIRDMSQLQKEKNVYQEGCKYSRVKTNVKKIPKAKELKISPDNNVDNVTTEMKCVYYSEKQSSNVGDVPGVPPCTPNEVIVNGIASLSDIKSQRNIKQKLRELKDKHAEKEKEILNAAKLKEVERKLQEKKKLIETQRRQIYAANKILAEIEHKNYMQSKTQIQGLPL